MGALELDSSESGRIDGDAGVPFAFQLDRFVLANDFTAKFQRPAFVGHFDKFWLLAGTRRGRWNNYGRISTRTRLCRKFTMTLLHTGFDDGLQQSVLCVIEC